MITLITDRQDKEKYFLYAKILSALFFAMYGLVPYLLNIFEMFDVHWAEPNLHFSLLGALFVLSLKPSKKILNLKQFYTKIYLPKWQYATFFTLALTMFYFFPWHDDRESFGASLSALMRAVWLIVIFKSINQSERFRFIIIILTMLLMFIDESRTYFMIMLMILAARSNYRKTFFVLCIIGVIFTAATRMGVNGSITNSLLYGVIGEAYNATKPVGQILLVSGEDINIFGHLLHTFLQPFIFPAEFIVNKLTTAKIPGQSSYFSEAVSKALQEQLSPMGGWYIVADFVHYGVFGAILMLFYLSMTWKITNFLLNTNDFPFGAFVFFISIKATPFIYFKFIFYILAVKLIISLFSRLRFS
jgi:hypothetical protein